MKRQIIWAGFYLALFLLATWFVNSLVTGWIEREMRLSVYIDKSTGVHYIAVGGAITPRIYSDGFPYNGSEYRFAQSK